MAKKLNIVFDLFGVLFYTHKWEGLKYLGFKRCLNYLIYVGRNPLSEYLIILDTMRREEPGEFQETVTYKGIYLPETFCLWLKGQRTAEDLLDKLLGFLKVLEKNGYFVNNNHRDIIRDLLKISIVPSVRMDLIYPSKGVVNIVKALAREGHNCYVLSNIDTQLHSLLQKKYPDIFENFIGQTVSCEVASVKPQKEIYLDLQNKYGLELPSCYFIDDQEENIIAAHELGMQGHLFTTKKNLEKNLKKINQ